MDVGAIGHLPAAAHAAYAHALTDALHPVFLAAAGIAAVAFALACLLPEVPLRQTAGASVRRADERRVGGPQLQAQ